MYYQVEQVLEQQEPEIEKFYKGRGLLICEAKQGDRKSTRLNSSH